MFDFNREADYIRTVDKTKTLIKDIIKYFGGLTKKVDTKKLEEMLTQIDNPFMMLVCGEYNSGKSTFINSLLGDLVCKTGTTPTTEKINIIKNGYADIENIQSPIINTMDMDIELLKNFLIVDTPGTNSIVKEHQEVTKEFIHRAELILFITSADRPFSESERQMLELISTKYGKKIVFVLNKIDQKEDEDIKEIISFIEDNSIKLLDFKPRILPVSSKLAFEGLKNEDKEKTKRSNINKVIDDINEIYKINALYLKLDSPLSTSLKLLGEVEDRIELDRRSIEEEVSELDNFYVNLNQYHKELVNDYNKKVKSIKANFFEIENDMYKVIDSITFLKLLKSKLPFTKSKIEYNFEKQVDELTKKVNSTLEDLTYNVAQDSKKYFEQAHNFIERQMVKYKRNDMYIQTASPDYIETGKNILDTLRNTFDMKYKHLNLPQESKNIKKSIDEGFSASLIGSVASIGLGGGLLVLLPTAVLDITGVSISIILAVSSLFILPAKKKKAKAVLSSKFKELADNLTTVTIEKIEEDLAKIKSKIERELRPYKSFVESEKEVIRMNKESSEKLKKTALDIKSNVENRFKKRKGL